MDRAGTVATRAYPWALVLVLAAGALPPVGLNPAAVTLAGILIGSVLLAIGTFAGVRSLSKTAALGAMAAVALALAITVRSSFAANPSVSLWGIVGQHGGAGLWVLGAVWLLAGMTLADPQTLKRTVAVVAIAGATFSLATLAETIAGSERGWGSAAGVFENSTSAGEFAAVALVAAVAWALAPRSRFARAGAVACALTCGVGIAAADSRAGVAAVAASALFAWLAWASRSPRTRVALAVCVPAALAGATAALVAASAGMLGLGALEAVAALGTARDAIWRAAAAQFSASPWVGHGADQFSAWATWSFDGNAISYSGTYDPHNVVLSILLAGGLLAGALAAIAAAALLRAQLEAIVDSGRQLSLVAVATTPVALAAAALFAWPTPAAVVAVCAIIGALLGATSMSGTKPVTSPWPMRATAIVAIVCATAIALLGVRAVGPEHTFLATQKTADASTLESLYRTFPDPAYAVAAIDRSADQGTPAVTSLLSDTEPDARWHVDRALLGLAQAASPGADGSELRSAMEADPSSGLWFAIAASQAQRVGMSAEASRYARFALSDPALDATTLAYLEQLAALETR